MIPFAVAFEPDATIGFTIWERTVDILFAFDLLVNFRTTYVNEKTGFEISDNKKVALNYAKSVRCYIDIGATIPFEVLLEAFDPTASSK